MGCGASRLAPPSLSDLPKEKPTSEYAPTLPKNSVPERQVPAHAHLVGRSTEDGGQCLHEAVGCCTAVGHRPRSSAQGEVLNQDRGIVAWPLGGKDDEARLLLGVFDGHGPRGEAVSDFVALTLLASLKERLAGKTSSGEYKLSPTDGQLSWVAAGGGSEAPLLELALEDVETRLCVEHKHLAHHNGTTAVLALFRPGAVSVASVGDSRCVAAVANLTSGSWVARDLSTDHTPEAPRERARILELGGALTSDEGGHGKGHGKDLGNGHGHGGGGAVRVLSKSSLSSLALSRSVGDLAFAHVGVTAEPDLHDEALGERHRCLILATDGVWAFVTSQEAVSLVERHCAAGARAACHELVREAATRWHASEGAYRDDITALLVLIDNGHPSVAKATATGGGGGGGGVGGGGDAAPLSDTLEFLSAEELASEMSDDAALLPPEARSAQRRKQRLFASRSPGGHRRTPAQRGGGDGGGGGGVGPRAAKWRSPDFGAEPAAGGGGADPSPDFRRRRLTLSNVDSHDLTKLAAMADELDAGDW